MPEIVHGLEALARLDPGGSAPILCATHRLTRDLRLAHGRLQASAGRSRWTALPTATVGQWCGAVLRQALLAGELPAERAPRLLLSAMQERMLWEAVIAEDAAEDGGDFFDRPGLAAAAAEANVLAEAWQLPLDGNAAQLSTEARRFLLWREAFRRRCRKHGWLERVRGLAWQIEALARGAGRLPGAVVFAGFDAAAGMAPQVARLTRVLAERGVRVFELVLENDAPGQARVVALADRALECRTAAAWAARRLVERPEMRIGIVVPELAALRDVLQDALDEYLNPAAFNPALADGAGISRRHAFAAGTPLAREPLVHVALELLALAANPGRVEQARVGELLRGPFWSLDAETDARHRIEALAREKLPPEVTLARLLRLARRVQGDGPDAAGGRSIHAPRLVADLEGLAGWRASHGGRQPPSAWAGRFAELLGAVGWPGGGPLSLREAEARAAFGDALDEFGGLDAVLGKVGAGEAARRLARLCAERMFEFGVTGGAPQVLVMGMLEPAAAPFDALWVMGMNEHLWPPAARPNPLLPADLQRRGRTPGASSEVQVELARTLHERWLRGAAEVVFSWAQADGGRELRPTPLLAGLAAAEAPELLPELGRNPPLPVAGQAVAAPGCMERLDDAQAPPVAPGEKVKGGTRLLKAQAICPAWAFYQFRLGAKALAEPVEGLDPAGRGTLLHAVLEAFWKDRGLHDLLAMDVAARATAVAAAVAAGVAAFTGKRDEPLPPRFLALEEERLARLVLQWLELEAGRPAPFRVVACERVAEIEIEGIAVRMAIDRIDRLDDGRLLILDYKTGSEVNAKGWAGSRLTEPQLPIYAAHAAEMAGEISGAGVAGVALAKVRLDDCAMVGVAAEDGLLPGIAGIEDKKAHKLFADVADWPALLAQWRANVAAIAREVGAGEAAASFANEKDLEWCEVKPLLRLAERKAQMERRAQIEPQVELEPRVLLERDDG